MRAGEFVFVDSGAWIALALQLDPLHDRARLIWEDLSRSGAAVRTSIPVVLETFTFLERNARRDVALAWQASLGTLTRFSLVECSTVDLAHAWAYFRRRNLHGLSAVDAASFVIMTRLKIRHAFAFDHHFAAAGFSLVG